MSCALDDAHCAQACDELRSIIEKVLKSPISTTTISATTISATTATTSITSTSTIEEHDSLDDVLLEKQQQKLHGVLRPKAATLVFMYLQEAKMKVMA